MRLLFWRTISILLMLLISWQASARTSLFIGQTFERESGGYVKAHMMRYVQDNSHQQASAHAAKKAVSSCNVDVGNYTAVFSEQGSNVDITVETVANNVLIDYGVNGSEILGYWFNKSGNKFVYTIKNVKKNDVIKFRLRVMKSSGQDITDYTEYSVGKCGGNGGDKDVATPKNLTSSATTSSVNLSWEDKSAAETGHEIERKAGSGSFSSYTTVGANITSYTDNSVTKGQTYQYRVRAYSANEKSGYSNVTTVTIPDGNTGNYITGKFTPKNGKTLLAIGQDLKSLSDYREGGMPEPGAVVTYSSFYNNTVNEHGINYGALGLDNGGNPTGVDTDWGAGPLNAASSCLGWEGSALVMALSMTENWNPNGLADIAAGRYNANIDKLVTFSKKFSNKVIYLRIGYEFDGRWNGEEGGGYHKREEYKRAWRHIVTRMRSQGANNVAFVWQSSTSPVDDVADRHWGGQPNKENIGDWYPGDDVVDWCGLSWFIAPDEAINTFDFPLRDRNQDVLANDMIAFARARKKPVMVCEATPQGYDLEISEHSSTQSAVGRNSTGITYEGAKVLLSQGDDAAKSQFGPGTWFENISADQAWDRWFKPYLNFIKTNKDIIRAVVYINANWETQGLWDHPYEQGYWGDSRIEANPRIKELWLNETNNSSFWLLGGNNLNSKLEGANSLKSANKKALGTDLFANDLKIFPVPARDNVQVEGLGDDEEYKVFGQNGKLLLKGLGKNVNISTLDEGVYFLKARGQKIKIVKY